MGKAVFAGAPNRQLTPPRGAGWFDNLRGEEFRALYQARARRARNAQRGHARFGPRALLACRALCGANVACFRRPLQSGFMRVLRGRDRVGRRVSILLPARFPSTVDANLLMRCAPLRHVTAPRRWHVR